MVQRQIGEKFLSEAYFCSTEKKIYKHNYKVVSEHKYLIICQKMAKCKCYPGSENYSM